jgi:hypothetical protein
LHGLHAADGIGESSDEVLCKVVVADISGRPLEMQLPSKSTVEDVKNNMESSWRVSKKGLTLIVDARVVDDHETVGALIDASNANDSARVFADTLCMTKIVNQAVIQKDHEDFLLFLSCFFSTPAASQILQKVRDERSDPTSPWSMTKILAVLDEAGPIIEV